MIELSSREKVILKKLLEELEDGEFELCALAPTGAVIALATIEQALVKDILREYID